MAYSMCRAVTVNLTIEDGGLATLNGLNIYEVDDVMGKLDIVNRGRLIFESGQNVVSDGEGQIVLTNLDNRDGQLVIEPGARVALSATIEDYSGGGATFDAGQWEVIGTPWAFDNLERFRGNNPPPVEDYAQASIRVTRVENKDNYLGGVDFEEQDYNLEDYDTALKINASHVTLSGAADFPYFNTVEENRGTFNLRNGIRFHTAGDLLNTGEINVENGALLDVRGDLLIHGGSVRLAGRSGLGILDFARIDHDYTQHKIEIVGGELSFADDAFLQIFLAQVIRGAEQYALGGDWIVRESVEIDPASGAEVTKGARVDLGIVDRITRYAEGRLVLDGANVEFDAIQGLGVLEKGRVKDYGRGNPRGI